MVDPAWLPSTVMQTLGAIYAISIAVLIFTLQLYNSWKVSAYEIHFRFMLHEFNNLTSYVIGTIVINGFILALFSFSEQHKYVVLIGIILSLLTLILSLYRIVNYSKFLLNHTISLFPNDRQFKPSFNIGDVLDNLEAGDITVDESSTRTKTSGKNKTE